MLNLKVLNLVKSNNRFKSINDGISPHEPGVISSVCLQVSLTAALGTPVRKRKALSEEELQLRKKRREEAAAKRAKLQEEEEKRQEEKKHKKR